ncbi:MAG: hypothetical protein JWM98_147 [Thermoleophilia bacterium]|nr:hypothetical protein [Thermoleophilia bacterium]
MPTTAAPVGALKRAVTPTSAAPPATPTATPAAGAATGSIRAAAGTWWDPKPTPSAPSTPSTPSKRPGQAASVDDRLAAARALVPDPAQLSQLPADEQDRVVATFAAARSRAFDAIASELEARIPAGKAGEQGLEAQLEEAQQGAKPERERRLREEVAASPIGAQLLEFERRAGVTVTIHTDEELAAAHQEGDAGVSYGDNVDINSRTVARDVYLHEMTHQVDSKTKVIALDGDTRSKEQVVAEATANYERLGLDPSEVAPLVDATYGKTTDGDAATHGHTRLTEARQHRLDAGGQPMSAEEISAVADLSLPRERDINVVGDLRGDDRSKDGAARDYAKGRGIAVDGRSTEDVAADLSALADAAEAKIVAIEQRGGRVEQAPPSGPTKQPGTGGTKEGGGGIGGGGIGGAAGGGAADGLGIDVGETIAKLAKALLGS